MLFLCSLKSVSNCSQTFKLWCGKIISITTLQLQCTTTSHSSCRSNVPFLEILKIVCRMIYARSILGQLSTGSFVFKLMQFMYNPFCRCQGIQQELCNVLLYVYVSVNWPFAVCHSCAPTCIAIVKGGQCLRAF